MEENGLPALDQLEATPEILRALMSGLSDEDARWKPAPDRWSIAEILEHLSHVEGHCFRPRVESAVEEDRPAWPKYDQNAYDAQGKYSGGDPEESFAHFEDQREENLEYLRRLPEGSAERSGMHAELGPVKVSELLHEWAFHDLGHIRQIAEIVRARRYFPNMGAFRKYYQVKP